MSTDTSGPQPPPNGPVFVIDDDKSVRKSYELVIRDLSLPVALQEGPLPALSNYIELVCREAQAVLCDHHLRLAGYSPFNGAPLVAGLYQRGLPALLCTRWYEAAIDEIRSVREFIPVILRPGELTPEAVEEGLRLCSAEISGKFRPERRPWRNLVRIEALDFDDGHDDVFVVVPGWRSQEVVRIRSRDFPVGYKERLRPGLRLYAEINLGAETNEELYFRHWALA